MIGVGTGTSAEESCRHRAEMNLWVAGAREVELAKVAVAWMVSSRPLETGYGIAVLGVGLAEVLTLLTSVLPFWDQSVRSVPLYIGNT